MIQHVKTTNFNTGRFEQNNDPDGIGEHDDRETVKKVTNASRMRQGGQKDHLKAALSTVKPALPNHNNRWSHTSRVRPRGVNYHPMGEEGSVQRTGTGRGVYSYGSNVYSAEPANAVGTYANRRGENAVGSPPNRRGENANPRPRVPNRPGSNAIGNPPNRFGASALASDFRPRFKGGPASRRA